MTRIPDVTKTGDSRLAICKRLREFGYASNHHIRLYGEEFYLASDPIPDDDGFAIEAIARRSGKSRLSAFHYRWSIF